MFTSDHEIWKYAHATADPDDWLPVAVDLVGRWSSQKEDEVEFDSTSEIVVASLLLIDDLLPPSARIAYANLMLDTINSIHDKKVTVECLHIEPPPPGRKSDIHFRAQVIFGVKSLIEDGVSKTEAYDTVANQLSKSPDTIRRIYERALKGSNKTNRGK